MRRVSTTISVVLVLGAAPGITRASEFTFSHHEGTGRGSANVFDGGVVVSDSGTLTDPTFHRFSFNATDLTSPGSFGASASAFGISQIVDFDQGIRMLVEFRAVYDPSPFAGGDRPGGMAEGELFSVIEFLMPADQIDWVYGLRIDDTFGFSGSTSVVFENVTQSETLLTLTETILGIEGTLSANTGDLMRITSDMSGSGSVPAGVTSSRQYGADFAVTFTIPEPSTLSLLLLSALTLIKPRRR